MEKLVEVVNLTKLFPFARSIKETILRRGEHGIRAVDKVSFSIERGARLGVAGESGCGKTTLGKLLVRLYKPTSGKILFETTDISSLRGRSLRNFRRESQLIFQNPYTAINPRFTVYRFIAESLIIHNIGNRSERKSLVCETLDKVRLSPPEKFLQRYPHQLSGGERQRAVIARALILGPKFLVADEPASMLDVSVRAGILQLLQQIANEAHLTVMYISHDLSLLRYLCNRIAIMYLGKIVEIGSVSDIIDNPLHPYTQALIAAVPVPDPDFEYQSVRIKGTVPTVSRESIRGCIFADRCIYTKAICRETSPPPIVAERGRVVYCHLIRNGEHASRKLDCFG